MAAERVLIGLLDTSCRSVRLTPTDSKIGGLPDFYQSCSPSVPPACTLCASVLYLLAQIYCPHEGSPYHRLLHIFFCSRVQCQYSSKSWTVLRSQEREASKVIKKPSEKPTRGKWCNDEDDWGTPPSEECTNDSEDKKEDTCDLTEQELTLSNLSLDTTSTMATTVDHGHTQYYPSCYIQVIEEPVEFYDSKELARKAVDSTSNCSGSSAEAYEKTTTKHGDKTFYKFHKRLSRCPEQILRYCWDGTPLLITDKTLPAPPPCQECGAPRVFELQLMPPLVYLLKTSSGVNVEFGTVLVYTCSKSCWYNRSSAHKEYICIQSEPEDKQLMKWSL